MPKNIVVALDLEMNQPSGRIIQIGAVIGDLSTGEILTRFDGKVNPGEPLAPVISELTGIRESELLSAPALPAVYPALVRWMAPWDDERWLNPLVWGGGDSQTLREQLGCQDERWAFGRRWIDVKTVFVAWRMAHDKEIQGGLARAMTKVGLAFEGRRHYATDDALNTFRMYRALLRQFKDASFEV